VKHDSAAHYDPRSVSHGGDSRRDRCRHAGLCGAVGLGRSDGDPAASPNINTNASIACGPADHGLDAVSRCGGGQSSFGTAASLGAGNTEFATGAGAAVGG
jgi:hypothetical protein